jgi:regulatory protein
MDDEIYQRLLGFGLNFVSIRPRSEKEIREYILKKIHRWKISSAFFEKVINRLHELGYVDDLKFACAYISSRNRFRPKGKMLIRMELRKKGVDQDCIERALELSIGNGTEGDQADLARHAAVKKLRSLERYDRTSQRNKLYSFLMRRGFDHTTISSVIDGLTPKGLQ